jgi:hypothetical protein
VLAELIDLLPPGVGHVSERARQSNPPQ